MKFFYNFFFKAFASLQVYTNLDGNRSHLVNTAWAMLALIDAGQVYIIFYCIMFANVEEGLIFCCVYSQFPFYRIVIVLFLFFINCIFLTFCFISVTKEN